MVRLNLYLTRSFVSGLIFFTLLLILTACGGANKGPIPNDRNFKRAEQSFLQGNYPAALNYYQAFLENNPGSPYAPESIYRVGLCHLTLGQYPEAIRAFERARRKAKNKHLRAQTMASLGQTAMFQHNYSQATKYYRQALKQSKTNLPLPEVYFNLGTALMRQGNWSDGRYYFRKLLDTSGQDRLAEAARERLQLPKNIFTVQISKYRNKDNAQTHQAELKKEKNITASIKMMLINKELFYFVWAGSFTRWRPAKQKAEELRAKGVEAIVVP